MNATLPFIAGMTFGIVMSFVGIVFLIKEKILIFNLKKDETNN